MPQSRTCDEAFHLLRGLVRTIELHYPRDHFGLLDRAKAFLEAHPADSGEGELIDAAQEGTARGRK